MSTPSGPHTPADRSGNTAWVPPGRPDPAPIPAPGPPPAPTAGTPPPPADPPDKAFWHRPLAVIGVIGGGVALVGALITLLFQLFPDVQPKASEEPEVEVAAFTVDREKNIRADFTGVTGQTREDPDGVTSSMVDVTLKNNSENPVVFTAVSFRFSEIVDAVCPRGGGDGTVQARYDIKVPDGTAKGATIDRKMRFILAPHTAETLAFTVGPERDSSDIEHLSLYQFTIRLTRDDGSSIDLESVGHATPDRNLEGAKAAAREAFHPAQAVPEYTERQQHCWSQASADAARIAGSAQHVSPELKELASALSDITRTTPSGPMD